MSSTEKNINELPVVSDLRPDEAYFDFSFAYTPSSYIVAEREGWTFTRPQGQATDREIIQWATKCGTFDFLREPEEDIYSLSDGKEVW